MTKPFIPRDKPRSFVVFVISALSGLLVAGPLIGAGLFFDVHWLFKVGYFGFMACWVVAAVFGIAMGLGNFTGRYRDLEAREWRDQVW